MDRYTLHHGDCIEVMRGMADNSVDAIVTDPPYFRVLNEPWDRAWDSAEEFTTWLRTVAEEWHRILKPDGTLYCFASPQMAARVEVEAIAPAGFIVHNRIVWHKTTNTAGRASREMLTRFHTADNERIIMAAPLKEHREAKNADRSYQNALHALAANVYAPIREYLANERDRAGFTDKEVDRALGCNGMASHWFGASQWVLPSAKRYRQLQDLFNRTGDYEYLRRDYEDLRRDYEYLRRDYEDLRRPFNIGPKNPNRPQGEVWRFAPPPGGKDRHPCQKPTDLLQHIILTSTRPDALVLDCFAGSGATGVTALQVGRRFVGVELSEHWHAIASRNLAKAERLPDEEILFPRAADLTAEEIQQLAFPNQAEQGEASA